MTRALYLTSVEPQSGKSLVALGVLEMLSRQVRAIGYFRPVIGAGDEPDETIELFRERYRLDQTYEQSYGVTTDAMRGVGTSSEGAAVLDTVMDRFEALARRCDAVLIEGTDFTGAAAAFEFALNTELATNLGASALLVVPARDRPPAKVRGALAAARGQLVARGVPLVGLVVNRVPPGSVDDLRDHLDGLAEPVWVMPEVPGLDRPTLREVARSTGARLLLGDAAQLDREVLRVKVAAMGLAHFLEHLEPETLVVVPGDRADVVVASLTTRFTSAFAAPAGVLLTGGLEPDDQVLRFAAGLEGPSVPVLIVEGDTYATAASLTEIRPRLTSGAKRKIAVALRAFDENVDAVALGRRISLTESSVVTPLMFEHRLVAAARTDKRRIVLPEGDDERVLRAAERLRDRDVVDLTLLGDPTQVADRARVLGLDLSGIAVMNPETDRLRAPFAELLHQLRRAKGMSEETAWDLAGDVSYFGTMLVHRGLADGMVSGATHTTADTVRPALQVIRTEPGTSIVSSVFFMALPDRVLVYGDCAVNPDPDAEALATIAISSARTAEAFGIDPFVAMLSYSTGSSGTGADVDKVRAATELVRTRAPHLRVEGPIQYDAAVDATVARSKLPDSDVAGRATVLVFPDLNTGNNTYKAVQRSAGAVAVGPVLQGLRKPVNDLSRGATVDDIVNTVVITAVQAQQVAKREAGFA